MWAQWNVGEVLAGRWEIHAAHGSSDLACTFSVHDRVCNEAMLAKAFVPEVFAKHTHFRQGLSAAAETWIRVPPHRNVAEARLLTDIEGHPLLLVEYVGGESLRSLIGTPRLLRDLGLSLKLSIDLCEGMVHLCASGGGPHGDVKAANCVITEENSLRVTNYGLIRAFRHNECNEGRKGSLFARLFGSAALGVRPDSEIVDPAQISVVATRAGLVAGSCSHMAPELFDGSLADIRSDIYSFGVLLYEILTGRIPFRGNTWKEFERAHRSYEYDRVPNPALRRVVDACLEKTPANRPHSFPDVRLLLQDAQEHLESTVVMPNDKVTTEEYRFALRAMGLRTIGRSHDAIDVLAGPLARYPEQPRLWHQRARALLALEQYEEALVAAERGLQLDKTSSPAWHVKAVAMQNLGRGAEALESYRQASGNDPRSTECLAAEGLLLVDQSRFHEALPPLQRAVAVNPRSVPALRGIARAYEGIGRPAAECLAAWQSVTDVDPSSSEAWLMRGSKLVALQRIDGALECFATAAGLDPRDVRAWAWGGAALALAGRNDLALTHLSRATELTPDFVEAWLNKGTLLRKMGRNEDSLEALERAHALLPMGAAILLSRAETLVNLNCMEDALECCDRAIVGDRSNREAWLLRAGCLHRLNRKEEVVLCYDHLLAECPDDLVARSGKAMALITLKRYGEAEHCLDEVLSLRPADEDALVRKAHLRNEERRYDEALELADRVLVLNANNRHALMAEALALEGLHRFGEAADCYDQLKKCGYEPASGSAERCYGEIRKFKDRSPDETSGHVAWFNRGEAFLDAGEYSRAIEAFDRSISLNPKYAPAWSAKGYALLLSAQQNRLDPSSPQYQRLASEVIAYEDRAIELSPRYKLAWLRKVPALLAKDRRQEALLCYQEADRLGHPSAKELMYKVLGRV